LYLDTTRPSNAHPDGGIIKKEAPIHISNVQLVDPETNEATKVGYKFDDGKKLRYAKKSGKALDK
jgi:large subunit ribosomal protein L24